MAPTVTPPTESRAAADAAAGEGEYGRLLELCAASQRALDEHRAAAPNLRAAHKAAALTGSPAPEANAAATHAVREEYLKAQLAGHEEAAREYFATVVKLARRALALEELANSERKFQRAEAFEREGQAALEEVRRELSRRQSLVNDARDEMAQHHRELQILDRED